MQRLTLIAAGLIGALSLSAVASAHSWKREGARVRFDRDNRGREMAEARRYEAPRYAARYDHRLYVQPCAAPAHASIHRVIAAPYAQPERLAFLPRLPIPGGYISLPGLVLNLR